MKRLKHRLKSLRKNNLIGFKTVPLLSGAVLFLGVENKDNFRYNDFIATGAWWNWYTRTLEVRMPYGLEVRVLSRPFTIMVSIA